MLAPYAKPAQRTPPRDPTTGALPWSGRDDVVVILFDDAFTDEPGVGWPIPYLEHAWLLGVVGSLDPATVFVDFAFKERSSDAAGFETLRSVVRRLEADGTPVFFAAPRPTDGDGVLVPLGEDVRLAGDPDRLVLVESLATPGFYPLTIAPPEGRADSDRWQSPALRQFLEGCRLGSPAPATCPSAEAIEAGTAASAFRAPAWLRWPVSIPGAWHPIGWRQCAMTGPTASERIGWSAKVLGVALTGGVQGSPFFDVEDRLQGCPPVATIRASQVRETSMVAGTAFEDFIRDKHVIIGGQFVSVFDYVESPVHGLVPGSFFHAVALANLLAYGDEYTREASHLFGPVRLIEATLVSIVTIAMIVVGRRLQARAVEEGPEYQGRRSDIGVWLLASVAVLVLVVTVAVLSSIRLMIEPINYLGISGLGVIMVLRFSGPHARKAVSARRDGSRSPVPADVAPRLPDAGDSEADRTDDDPTRERSE